MVTVGIHPCHHPTGAGRTGPPFYTRVSHCLGLGPWVIQSSYHPSQAVTTGPFPYSFPGADGVLPGIRSTWTPQTGSRVTVYPVVPDPFGLGVPRGTKERTGESPGVVVAPKRRPVVLHGVSDGAIGVGPGPGDA